MRLGKEANAAAEKAAAAAVQAEELADAVLDEEAKGIVKEIVAGYAVVRALEDKLFGRIDRVPGDIKAELNLVSWRRNADEARDPLLKEEHNWMAHVQVIERHSRAAWADYRRRLLGDASATFDGGKERTS